MNDRQLQMAFVSPAASPAVLHRAEVEIGLDVPEGMLGPTLPPVALA